MNGRAPAVAAALMLASCGGGGGSSSTPAAPQSKALRTGSVVLSIPAGGAQSSGRARYPQFVSPNASSVSLSINGGTAQFFDVSSTSSLCASSAGGRTCTLTFGAPPGTDTFAFTVFSGAGGAGTALATGTTAETVGSGSFGFSIGLNAVVGTVIGNITGSGSSCSGLPTNANNTIFEGCAGSATATIAVLDPSGAPVTGSAAYANAIGLGASDPSVTASPSTVTAPGQSVTLTYDGNAFGSSITNSLVVTLSVAGTNIPITVPVRRAFLYVANSNAPFGGTPAGGGNVAIYAYGASGSAAPVATITTGNLTNPVQPLLDANGNLYVLDNGPWTSQSNPFVNVYSIDLATHAATLLRTISGLSAVTSNTACESMVLSPDGTKLIVQCDDGTGTYHVFPASGNGAASSLQLYSLADASASAPNVGMALDGSGANLYVADTRSNTIHTYDYAGLPTSGFGTPITARNAISGSPIWGPLNAPLDVVVDTTGTLYVDASYFSSSANAGPDANNQIAMWNSSAIPCNNCVPTATMTGTPFTTHAPTGIALDYAGNLYVGNGFTNAISVIAHGTIPASGNVNNPAVARTLDTTGSNANVPVGMTVGP